MPYKDPKKRAECKRRWQENNKEKAKKAASDRKYKRRYGITKQQKDEMFEAQGFGCASCGTKEPTNNKFWHVDHCHSSGKVRGILCQRCNHALGLLDDDITKILALANYMHKNGRY